METPKILDPLDALKRLVERAERVLLQLEPPNRLQGIAVVSACQDAIKDAKDVLVSRGFDL